MDDLSFRLGDHGRYPAQLMSHEIALRSDRPPVGIRFYHRIICAMARQFVRKRCKDRCENATSNLSAIISQFSKLRTREHVHATFGSPDYSMNGNCSAWTDDNGEIVHPDLVDTYTVSHCTIDINYLDGSIQNVTGGVSIDGWDVCSNEYLERE